MEKMKKVVLVTGGQRSGKSTYAEKLALQLSGTSQAVYMATAVVPAANTSMLFMMTAKAENTMFSNVEGIATCSVSIIILDE